MKGAIVMLRTMNEYYFINMDAVNDLPAWAKLERYYNCEDFMSNFRNVFRKIKAKRHA